MGASAVRDVVLVPFPYSDLSQAKVRPAICLAYAQRGDWNLCQITSSPYGDSTAISLGARDFESGGLQIHSYARPQMLVTIHESTFIKTLGRITPVCFNAVVDRIIKNLRP